MNIIKKIFLLIAVISISCNAVLIFLVIKGSGNEGARIKFADIGKVLGQEYFTGALVVSIPSEGTGNSLEFGTAGITLTEGDSAYLQYIVYTNGLQKYLTNNYIFDSNIVRVKDDIITAVKSGESALQIFTNEGVKTVCVVTVTEGTK
ncbi:hypothetical protein FACS1894190_16360 [Spirochaetia bacterium]|nr:hypothetical protein FACS1894190_16360 [Spirochaetia bacterium]